MMEMLTPESRAVLQRVLAGDSAAREMDLEFLRPDGSAEVARWRAAPVHDGQGKMIGLDGTVCTPTASRRRHEETALLDEMPMGIIILSEELSTVHYANAASAEAMGMNRETLLQSAGLFAGLEAGGTLKVGRAKFGVDTRKVEWAGRPAVMMMLMGKSGSAAAGGNTSG